MSASGSAELARGLALQRQGRLEEAVAVFRSVIARDPGNADALHLLGITLGRMGRAQDAAATLAAAAAARPDNPYIHINLGNALGESGRHEEALRSYRRATTLKPDLVTAHRGSGHTLLRLARAEQALDSFNVALQLAPDDPYIHNDVGVALERLGRGGEAIGHFRRAVALEPRHVQAHHNLAMAEMTRGNHAEALAGLERALALEPQHAAMLANKGNALRALDRAAEALMAYDRSLAIDPARADAHHNRALALLRLGRPEEALASLERALALDSGVFAVHFHRGVALSLLERHEEGLASFDRALALEQRSSDAHYNRGVELGLLGRREESLAAFARAVDCRPDYVDAYNSAGSTLKGLGRREEALASFDRALAIAPDHAPTQWGKALLKLSMGEFEEGWPLHEARLRLEHLRPYQRSLATPRWIGGEDPTGRSILIHAEQGLGDTLQFCRYVPLLEARGAQAVFEVPATLRPLLRTLGMRGILISRGEPVPKVDCHCPLLSLPLAFDTRLATIPGAVPYLTADPAAIAAWRARLGGLPGLKVGLNWQGHPGAEKQAWIRGRSFALARAIPLLRTAGVTWISLQKGPAAGQRARAGLDGPLLQLTDPADTGAAAMLETAALMSALDLVITSDTAVAHLAGALGVPVWVALHHDPDWRWLLERADSPWYPSMRLFRQREAGDWMEVFERMAGELAALTR